MQLSRDKGNHPGIRGLSFRDKNLRQLLLFFSSFQNSVKEMKIVELPEVLCIHLKRFRFDTYLSTKISRHIKFPLVGLDMTPYLKEGNQTSHSSSSMLSSLTTEGQEVSVGVTRRNRK